MLTAAEYTSYGILRRCLRVSSLSLVRFSARSHQSLGWDTVHTPWQPAVGDLVYVQLHKGYNVASHLHRKFGAQRTGPFKVVRTYPNAYELALPPKWQIHPVISTKHLESHTKEADPYNCPIAFELPEPSDAADPKTLFEKIVERLLSPKGKRVSYLLRRKDMGTTWDKWHTATEVLAHRPDLLEAFASHAE